LSIRAEERTLKGKVGVPPAGGIRTLPGRKFFEVSLNALVRSSRRGKERQKKKALVP